MHGEDAHLVAAALIEVALDLDLAGGEPVQETLQRRDVRAFVGEGEGEELVERIGRLGAEPAERRAPAAARRENIGEELVRRDEIGAGEERGELVGGVTQLLVLIRPAAQLVPQPTIAAAVGEAKQRRLVDAVKRALEQAGERQVIVGEQKKLPERDEILDCKLCRQHHAIDAGDGDAALFQRAHQRGDEISAPAHQHHDVAGRDRAVARLKPLAGVEPLADLRGDRRGEAGRRIAHAMLRHRGLPRLRRFRRVGGHSSTRPAWPRRCAV